MHKKDAGNALLTLQRIGWRDTEYVNLWRRKDYRSVPQDPRINTVWYYPSVDLLFVKIYDVLYTVASDGMERFLYMPGPGNVPKQLIYLGEY